MEQTEGPDMSPVNDAIRALTEGRSSREVVDDLIRRGFTGRRRRPNCCPVAMFLRAVMPGQWLVDGNDAIYAARCTPTEYVTKKIRLPYVLHRIIKDFDRGYYPELERRGPDG